MLERLGNEAFIPAYIIAVKNRSTIKWSDLDQRL